MDYRAVNQPMYEDNTQISSVWAAMDLAKGDLVERSKEYARLTVPSICPQDNSGNTEQEHANVMIGPRVINFLAHKLIGTMFPHDRPFFKVDLNPQVEFDLSKEVEQKVIDQQKVDIAARGMQVTKVAMSKLNMVKYRPMAIETAKHLIVTGNATIRRLPDNTRVVYGVRDFGCFRGLNGEVYDIILRDISRLDGLEPDVQAHVRSQRVGAKHNDIVTVYSRWKRDGKRWKFTQAVDDTPMPSFSMIAEKDFPLIALTWTLAKGEHYGRGLVEDNIAAFNAIDVSTTALLEMFGIAADIKFLVNPGSVIDIIELIKSKRGTYHYGNKDDISSPEIGRQKGQDMQVLASTIERMERSVSQAFLMSSGGVRDAERVTAEEIRFFAKEIESAYGGLYSTMSLVWQMKEAQWAMSQVDESIPDVLEVKISTGMDALSQETALDSLRMSLSDLGLLNGVPEDVRGVLSATRIAKFLFMNRNLPFDQFTLTDEELQQRAAEQQQQQQALMQMQTQQNVQTEVAKGAAKG